MRKRQKQPQEVVAPNSEEGGPSIDAIFQRNEVRDTFRMSFLANRLVLPVYDEIKRVHGLCRGEYLLLFCLSYIDELTAQDVAEVTGRPRNSISRAVHRMLDEGYLTRSADPADGRQVLLRITPKGQRLHIEIIPMFVTQQSAILSCLSAAERSQLDQLLSKLVLGASQ